jgi:CRISPR/Cas system-associated exonuclease Cas4 (RecB family)
VGRTIGTVQSPEPAPSPAPVEPRLNPAQQRVIDLLGRSGERPQLADGLGDELRAHLDEELAPLAEHLDDGPLWISKHALATVHACEAHHAASLDAPFEWSPANARGIVAHRAIEILTHWQGEPAPADVVDETIARLTDETDRGGLGGYLAAIDEYDRAELRGLAVEHVTAFTECFPRLKPAWRPRTEAKVRVDLLDGKIVLSGKVDLSLGKPGDKVIIDLKTGSPRPQHREDLRFYALLETLTKGVPPRKLASYYLDAASTHPEDVTEGVLRVAVRRTVDGINQIVDVRGKHREPERTPGPQCNWCALLPGCQPGLAAKAAYDDTL